MYMALQAGSSNCDMYIFQFMVCAPAHHQKRGFLSAAHRSASGLGKLCLWSPVWVLQDVFVSVLLSYCLHEASQPESGQHYCFLELEKILRHQRGGSKLFYFLFNFLFIIFFLSRYLFLRAICFVVWVNECFL